MQSTYKLQKLINEFYPYAKKKLGFTKKAIIKFENDKQNAADVWGKTAHYDPSAFTITLYVTNRHPKDIIRSLAHELVHHTQNCKGLFSKGLSTEEGYAQNNPHLRKMEQEAYLQGNMLLRDYEDTLKKNRKTISTPISPIPLQEQFRRRDLKLYEQLKPKQILKESEEGGASDVNWDLVKSAKKHLETKGSAEDLLMFVMLHVKISREQAKEYLALAQELFMGSKQEAKEHGMDQEEAEQTAIDHLEKENRRYYSKLKKCGL